MKTVISIIALLTLSCAAQDVLTISTPKYRLEIIKKGFRYSFTRPDGSFHEEGELFRQAALARTLRQVATDAQVSDLDYWDSRGAILPWCIGLGGPVFYNGVITRAEINEEETH